MTLSKRLQRFLQISFSISLLALLIWLLRDQVSNVLHSIRNAEPIFFLAAFLVNLGIMVLLSSRMRLVFQGADISITLKESIQLTFIGYFFNNFLPTSAGGDVVKAYYGSRLSQKGAQATTAVLADRLFGLYGLFLLASMGVAFAHLDDGILVIRWLIWGITLSFTIGLLFLPRLVYLSYKVSFRIKLRWLSSILLKLHPVANNFSIISKYSLFAIAFSILTKFLSVVAVFLLSVSIQAELSFFTLVWLVPIAFAVSLLPSINGLGFREGTFVFFLGPIVGNDTALALALLWLGVYIVTDIIGGLIYAFSTNIRLAQGS